MRRGGRIGRRGRQRKMRGTSVARKGRRDGRKRRKRMRSVKKRGKHEKRNASGNKNVTGRVDEIEAVTEGGTEIGGIVMTDIVAEGMMIGETQRETRRSPMSKAQRRNHHLRKSPHKRTPKLLHQSKLLPKKPLRKQPYQRRNKIDLSRKLSTICLKTVDELLHIDHDISWKWTWTRLWHHRQGSLHLLLPSSPLTPNQISRNLFQQDPRLIWRR